MSSVLLVVTEEGACLDFFKTVLVCDVVYIPMKDLIDLGSSKYIQGHRNIYVLLHNIEDIDFKEDLSLKKIENLDAILTEAVNAGASDIHLAVGSKPRNRIYGSLKQMDYPVLDDRTLDGLIMPMLDALARASLHSTGQWDLAYNIQGVARFRVNIFHQKGALAGVFRVLNSSVPDYTKLGLPTSIFNLHRKRRGLILIVGATGSGKSTTLASFLDIINKNEYKHIITLEDPIEYVHWHSRSLINQREIGSDCSDFQSGLRAALREDPDVILIGEMRDLETVDIALTSAETGHLVCSTLHTMGVADTINRVLDMYPEGQQRQVRSILEGVLEAVVAQQLLPKIDGSGYIVAYEILYKNKQIKEFIRDGRIDDISDYLETDEAIKEGMCSMDSTIFSLYRKGKISRDTALDYSFDRKGMVSKIEKFDKGIGGRT